MGIDSTQINTIRNCLNDIRTEFAKSTSEQSTVMSIFSDNIDVDSIMIESNYTTGKLIHEIEELGRNPYRVGKTSESKNFKLSDMDIEVPQKIDISDFSEENLKKRYPSDKYTISTKMEGRIGYLTIKNKSTGAPVLILAVLTKENKEEFYRMEITNYDKAGEELKTSSYDGSGNLQFSNVSSIKCSEYASLINQEICAKRFFGIIPTAGKNLESLIKDITPNTAASVINSYDYDDESLISAIFSERGLSAKKRYKLAKHIIDAVVTKVREKNKNNADDLIDRIYKELEHQRDRWLPMNSENIDRYLKSLINGYSYKAAGLNGKLDGEFLQGETGDCWLLAGIKSIMNNPKAKEALEKNIKVLDNGDVEVTLMANNKTYKVTKEEIDHYKDYSDGDPDIRAIEIAVKKYKGIRDIWGGSAAEAFEILLGHGNLKMGTDKSIIDKIKSKEYLVTLVTGKHLAKIFNKYQKQTATDERSNDVKIYNHHSYSVLDADDNYVYFSNPHDSKDVLKMTTQDFLDMDENIGYLKLDDIGKEQFIYDETLYIIRNGLIGIGIGSIIQHRKQLINIAKKGGEFLLGMLKR